MLFSKANSIEICQRTFCCNCLGARPIFFINALDYQFLALETLNFCMRFGNGVYEKINISFVVKDSTAVYEDFYKI